MKNHKLMSIFQDLYYRLQVLPKMFYFWILILICQLRIDKAKNRLFTNRLELDKIWYMSSYLKGAKLKKTRTKLKKIERDFLLVEEDIKKIEEYFLERKKLFDYYLGRLLDQKIGE